MPVWPAMILGDRNPLVLGLVGEHRPGDDVADRPDARHLGPEVVVDLDLAALVGLEARPCRARARRCSAAGRSRRGRRPPRSSRRAAGGRLDGQGDRSPLRSALVTLVESRNSKPCFLKILLRFLADVAVHAGQDLVEELDDGDLRRRAAARPSRARARSRRRRSRPSASAPRAARARRSNRRSAPGRW